MYAAPRHTLQKHENRRSVAWSGGGGSGHRAACHNGVSHCWSKSDQDRPTFFLLTALCCYRLPLHIRLASLSSAETPVVLAAQSVNRDKNARLSLSLQTCSCAREKATTGLANSARPPAPDLAHPRSFSAGHKYGEKSKSQKEYCRGEQQSKARPAQPVSGLPSLAVNCAKSLSLGLTMGLSLPCSSPCFPRPLPPCSCPSACRPLARHPRLARTRHPAPHPGDDKHNGPASAEVFVRVVRRRGSFLGLRIARKETRRIEHAEGSGGTTCI